MGTGGTILFACDNSLKMSNLYTEANIEVILMQLEITYAIVLFIYTRKVAANVSLKISSVFTVPTNMK